MQMRIVHQGNISLLAVSEATLVVESGYLGELTVTTKLLAKDIRDTKNNKSPGVAGIPPKLLLKHIEQISTPCAKVFCLLPFIMERSRYRTFI